MKGIVFLLSPVHKILIEELTNAGYHCKEMYSIQRNELMPIIHEAVGIITSNRMNIDKVLIEAAIQLKWIGRLGSGMEIIDVPYAVSKNIKCISSPEGNANAVAEQALGMLLSLKHNISMANNELKQGIWERELNRGNEIEGQVAGIIGYGNNGRLFAQKLSLLGLKVLVYDKYQRAYGNDKIIECENLDRIYNEADIISFHVPLKDETYHYFNAQFLQNCKKPITLINLSRGNVVDTSILLEGIITNQINGAAIDVWEAEPLNRASDDMKTKIDLLLSLPNVIATPHIGGYTYQAVYKMSKILAFKILLKA